MLARFGIYVYLCNQKCEKFVTILPNFMEKSGVKSLISVVLCTREYLILRAS